MLWLVVLTLLSMVQADMKDIVSSNCKDVPEIQAVIPFNSSWHVEDLGKFYYYAFSWNRDSKCVIGSWEVDSSITCAEPTCYTCTFTWTNTTSNKQESSSEPYMVYPDKNFDTYVDIQNNGSSYPKNQIPIVGRCIYKNVTKTNSVYIDYYVDLGCKVYWNLYGRNKTLSDNDYKSAMLALDGFKLDKSTMTNITQDC